MNPNPFKRKNPFRVVFLNITDKKLDTEDFTYLDEFFFYCYDNGITSIDFHCLDDTKNVILVSYTLP